MLRPARVPVRRDAQAVGAVVNSQPEPPGSNRVSPPALGDGFRCVECGRRLVLRTLRRVFPQGLAGADPGGEWDTAPQVPPGGPLTAASGGWVCDGTECRRVYLVWDDIPSFLRQESGILSAAAHADVTETQVRD